jgi:hypothetical protein
MIEVDSFLDSHKRDVLVLADLKLKVTVTILLLDRPASLLVRLQVICQINTKAVIC